MMLQCPSSQVTCTVPYMYNVLHAFLPEADDPGLSLLSHIVKAASLHVVEDENKKVQASCAGGMQL